MVTGLGTINSCDSSGEGSLPEAFSLVIHHFGLLQNRKVLLWQGTVGQRRDLCSVSKYDP